MIDPGLRDLLVSARPITPEGIGGNRLLGWVHLQEFVGRIAHVGRAAVGVDPGQRHMGLALVVQDSFQAWELEFDDAIPGRAQRASYINQLVRYLLGSAGRFMTAGCLIEDAAGNARFGQAQLAEARTAAMIACADAGWQPVIISPMTWRKQLFGHGHIRAEVVWKDRLPGNAASALALALLAGRS